jgi:uncharacterized protein YqeY
MSDYGWNEDMGMPITGKIKADLKTAMLAKDNTTRNTLRMVISEYPKLTVPITLESGKKSSRVKTLEEITSEDVQDIIRGLVKSEKITLEAKGEATSDYIQLLEKYLPQTASEEEIVAWIKENIDFSQFKNNMQAMGTIMKHFGKNADGSLVKKILSSM